MATSIRLPDCQAARDELVGGFACLMTALFFLARSSFDLAILLLGAAPLLFGRQLFSHTPSTAPALAPLLSSSHDAITWSWRRLAQISLIALLAILAIPRVIDLASGNVNSVAGSDTERWLPFAFASRIPLWLLISGILNRLPRHLLAGLIGIFSAAAGPLLSLAWRDSLALAATALGLVLIADGLIASRQLCYPSQEALT